MNWLDKYQMKIFYFMLGILFIFTIFIGFSIRGKAASQTSTEIPYNVAEMSSYNEMMLSRIELALDQYRTGHNIDDTVPLLVWTQDGYYNGNFWQYYIMREPTLTSGYNYQDGYDFSNNYIRFTSQYQIESISIMNNGSIGGWSINLGLNAVLCGNAQSIQTTEGYYLPRYPFYYNGEPLIDSVYNTEVLISRVGGNVVSGSATEPDLSGDNIGSDKPDIDDYLPDLPNKPTFDDSSLESMVSSLYDFLAWEYNAFTGTIKGLIQYLGDTITYSLQKVIDNIKNSMKNFYDNMKSLFEPLLNAINEVLSSISTGIDYIKEPLSGTAIYDNLSGTGIMTNYNATVSAVNTFKDSFTNLNEPSTYTIPIHLEDLPSSMFGDLTTQYIDLSVINSVKPILRTFVWALVTYGLIITIFDSIANYINGGGDE